LDEIRKAERGKIIPVEIHRLIEAQEAGSNLSSNMETRHAVSLQEHQSRIISEIISATETSRAVGVQSAREHGYDEQNVEALPAMPSLVAEYLGRIALQVVRGCRQSIRGLILTGGDTALAVFKHLRISQVGLVDEILPGIPYGRVMGGEFADLAVVTKAGAFGDESALVKCIDFLESI
jgi:uncharacterized protein YgbK (DUF1537 family)